MTAGRSTHPLPRVRVGEPPELQIDDDEAAETPVEEEEIDAVPHDTEAALATDEGEVAAELEEERL